MRTVSDRVAASLALTALLACSGMGLCWRFAERGGHECCAETDTVGAPSKTCDSPAVGAEIAKLTPPQVALLVARLSRFVAMEPAREAGGRSYVPEPPLVLRI